MRFGLLRDLWTLSDEKELDMMAAGIAFYGFLALFPAVAAVIAISGFFADASYIRAELELARDYLPADSYTLISQQVEALLALNNNDLGIATILSLTLALWSARAGVAADPHRRLAHPRPPAASAHLLPPETPCPGRSRGHRWP